MSIWDGLETAKPDGERGIYLKPGGLYSLQVERMLAEQKRKGAFFIAEFTVLQSNHPAHAVGSQATWMQNLGDKNIAFPPIVSLMAALMGLEPKADVQRIATELSPYIRQYVEQATGPQNAFAGKMVDCETGSHITKERKIEFTDHYWHPYTGKVHAPMPNSTGPAPMPPIVGGDREGWRPPMGPPAGLPLSPPSFGVAPGIIHNPPPVGSLTALPMAPPAPRTLSPDGRYYLDQRTNTWQPT